jgi:uncharacterized ferredoxin-like protein
MTCFNCENKAEVRCSKHGIGICGSISCIRMHRWPGGSCDFVAPRRFEPMDWVVAIGAAAVLVAMVAIIWVHA